MMLILKMSEQNESKFGANVGSFGVYGVVGSISREIFFGYLESFLYRSIVLLCQVTEIFFASFGGCGVVGLISRELWGKFTLISFLGRLYSSLLTWISQNCERPHSRLTQENAKSE